MPVQPQQLDPLPIPEAQKEDTGTPLVPPAAQPQAGMGWVKPSGAGAYVASQILTGWMAGRHVAQQRNLEKAKEDVVGAKTTYDVTAQSYQNLVDQGLDPNKPEDKQKLDAAKSAVTHAWNNYLDRAGKYSTPDEGGEKKSKGKKVKEGLHNAFMGQDPQFFVDSSLKVLRDSGPPVLSYGTSQDEKNRLALQQKQLKEADLINEERSKKLAKDADADALQKQYDDAVKSGDAKAADQARLGLANHGINVVTAQEMRAADAKAEAADIEAQNAISGYKILSQPGKTAGDLSIAQRSALKMPMDQRDDYLSQVGPGKRFKDNIAADRQFMHDQTAARDIAGSATDRMYNRIQQAEIAVLDGELRDPKTFAKYGLSAPLAKGQPIPKEILAREMLRRMKPNQQDRTDARMNDQKAIGNSIKLVLSEPGLSANDQKFYNDHFVTKDPELGTYVLSQEAPTKEEHGGHWWSGAKRETLDGLSPDEYQKKYQKFKDSLARTMVKVYGASPDRIKQALDSDDPAGFFADTADVSTPESKAMNPVPQRGKSWYRVTSPDGTQTQDMELTEEEAEVPRNQGAKVEVLTH